MNKKFYFTVYPDFWRNWWIIWSKYRVLTKMYYLQSLICIDIFGSTNFNQYLYHLIKFLRHLNIFQCSSQLKNNLHPTFRLIMQIRHKNFFLMKSCTWFPKESTGVLPSFGIHAWNLCENLIIKCEKNEYR